MARHIPLPWSRLVRCGLLCLQALPFQWFSTSPRSWPNMVTAHGVALAAHGAEVPCHADHLNWWLRYVDSSLHRTPVGRLSSATDMLISTLVYLVFLFLHFSLSLLLSFSHSLILSLLTFSFQVLSVIRLTTFVFRLRNEVLIIVARPQRPCTHFFCPRSADMASTHRRARSPHAPNHRLPFPPIRRACNALFQIPKYARTDQRRGMDAHLFPRHGDSRSLSRHWWTGWESYVRDGTE